MGGYSDMFGKRLAKRQRLILCCGVHTHITFIFHQISDHHSNPNPLLLPLPHLILSQVPPRLILLQRPGPRSAPPNFLTRALRGPRSASGLPRARLRLPQKVSMKNTRGRLPLRQRLMAVQRNRCGNRRGRERSRQREGQGELISMEIQSSRND